MRNSCHVQSVEKQGCIVNENGEEGREIAFWSTGYVWPSPFCYGLRLLRTSPVCFPRNLMLYPAELRGHWLGKYREGSYQAGQLAGKPNLKLRSLIGF